MSADAASKTYGDADPTLGWTATGLVGSDTLGGSLARAAGENAGGYAINQGTLANANYSISFTGNTLTITPKAITVSADAASKTYGDADPTLGWTATGLVGSDTLGGSLARAAGENAGGYAINQGTLANANYSISFTGNTLTITPAALTVTAGNASKTYDGQAWSGGNGVSYSGFVNGENESVLGGTLSYGGSSQGAVNAGSYGISASGLASGNYVISYVDGALTVNKAALTVTASDASKRYDGQAWSGGNGVSYSGFVNGEDASVLSGTLSYGGSSQGATAAGSYTITPGGLGSANYLIQFVDGQLQIGRAVTMDGGRVVSAIGPELARRAPTPPALAALMAAGLGQPAPLSLAQGFIALPATED